MEGAPHGQADAVQPGTLYRALDAELRSAPLFSKGSDSEDEQDSAEPEPARGRQSVASLKTAVESGSGPGRSLSRPGASRRGGDAPSSSSDARRFCKKCKLNFGGEVCPAAHPAFMYSRFREGAATAERQEKPVPDDAVPPSPVVDAPESPPPAAEPEEESGRGNHPRRKKKPQGASCCAARSATSPGSRPDGVKPDLRVLEASVSAELNELLRMPTVVPASAVDAEDLADETGLDLDRLGEALEVLDRVPSPVSFGRGPRLYSVV